MKFQGEVISKLVHNYDKRGANIALFCFLHVKAILLNFYFKIVAIYKKYDIP